MEEENVQTTVSPGGTTTTVTTYMVSGENISTEKMTTEMGESTTSYTLNKETTTTSDGIYLERWEVGLFSCFTHLVPNCLMVYFCPCVSLAQITSRMGLESFGRAILFWLLATIVFPIGIVATFFLRGKLRERFNIVGTQLNDFLLSCCCTCCVIAQMATHVKSYQPGSCSFCPVDTLPAYEAKE